MTVERFVETLRQSGPVRSCIDAAQRVGGRLSPFARRVLTHSLLVAAPFVFLIHLGLVWVWSDAADRGRIQAAAAQAQSMHKAAQELAVQFGDAETRMNSYLLTGHWEYLETFRNLEDTAPAKVRDVARFLDNRADSTRRMQALASDSDLVIQTLSRLTGFAAMPHGSAVAIPANFVDSEQVAMRKLRGDLAAIDDDAQRSLSQAMNARDRAKLWVGVDLVLAFIATIAGLLLFVNAFPKADRQTNVIPQPDEMALRAYASQVMAAYEVLKAEMLGPNGISEPARASVERMPEKTHRLPAALPAAPDQAASRRGRILTSVLETMSDGVVVFDSAGRPDFVNRAALGLLGPEIPLLPLKSWPKRISFCHDEGPIACSWDELPFACAMGGAFTRRADFYVRRDGVDNCVEAGIWLSVAAAPLRDEATPCGAVAFFSDVTVRRKTEEALSRAKDDAERANGAKSEFLSRMSHELRTPLNAILGFAQLLQMGRLPDQHQDSVQQILKGGKHLLALINEVLDIARIESGRLSLALDRVAASDIVQEAVTFVESQAAAKKLQVYIEAGAAWRVLIMADRQRLKQVLLNLISNAVKYNDEGGSVRISAEANGSMLRVSIADTGPGIPDEKLHLLFSPFERLGAERSGVEGTGIGLALTKRLVEAMNGAIGVSSKTGKGSTFWVELPVAQSENFSTGPSVEGDLKRLDAAVGSGYSPLVLYIEDNDSNVRLIARMLAHRPEIRLMAGSLGGDAVPLAQSNRPDMILLDMHLPDMDGHAVISSLRANPETAPIPVVVISADATPRQREVMLSEGASAYLTKPFEIEELLRIVDGALRPSARTVNEEARALDEAPC